MSALVSAGVAWMERSLRSAIQVPPAGGCARAGGGAVGLLHPLWKNVFIEVIKRE